MTAKKKLPRTATPAQTEVTEKSKLIRLQDLAPRQDPRAGGRVVFGQVQVQPKLKNQ